MKKFWFVYRVKSWHDIRKFTMVSFIETAAGAIKNITDLTLRALEASFALDSRLIDNRLMSRVTNEEISKSLEGATKIIFDEGD